jgi:hypothetical protein
MIEDRELATWREQWRSGAEPSPDLENQFHAKLHRKIRKQNLRFLISNLLVAIALIAVLIFAAWAVRQEPSPLRIGWAVGIALMVFGGGAYRIWAQRGTWRPEAQSTRAFAELWHRRVTAKIRLIRMAFYLIPGWILFCAVLSAANWSAIGPDIHAHPADWWLALGAIFLMVLVSFLWLAWYRRRRLAELDEVKRILDEMKD